MRARMLVVAIPAMVGFFACISTASADQTGLAGLHAWRQVGGKTCFVDHDHDGSGTGRDQQSAVREAIASWESFTALEYGSDWASFPNSISKNISCSRGAHEVSCRLTSIPCKGGVVAQQNRMSKKVRRVRN